MVKKLGVTIRAQEVFSRLRVAQDIQALLDLGLTRELIESLVAAGLLEPQDETVAPANHRSNYVNWPSQRGMLLDHTRTLTFQRAIEAVVRPGDRVIDVGTGSGILAMMASRAGAAQSVGLEFTAISDWARKLATHNGLFSTLVISGDAAAYRGEGPADLVMGEFAGMWLIEEWRHYAAFCAVRDRNLRTGGKVLPRAGRLFASAVDSRKLYLARGYGFWETPVYGFDFSLVRPSEIARPRRWVVTADPNNIIDTKELAHFDFLLGSERDFLFSTEVMFRYPAAGRFHGLIGHFELDMSPGVVLSTSPFDHDTHWHQSYFPIPAIEVPAGGEIAVRLRSFIDEVTGTLSVAIAVAPLGDRLTSATQEHVFELE
jgi:hypothetical protein